MVDQFKDGTIAVSPGDWASFLYSDDDYNIEEPEVGLFRGYLVLRVSSAYLIKY